MVFAQLHPLLVHLPIGILLLALVFEALARYRQQSGLLPAVPVLLRAGAATALFSCISGWLLGRAGGYEEDALLRHQYLGLATAALAMAACFIPWRFVFNALSGVLLLLTGWFGSTLTHGEGFLSATAAAEHKRPADEQEAIAYQEIIAPILRERCVACHGGSHQKGGLRLDRPEGILKGGKNGPVLTAGNVKTSEMIRRCLLPLGHDEHMPPREKPQLSSAELDILQWWIAQGADFQKKTKEIPQTGAIRNALRMWKNGGEKKEEMGNDLPQGNPAPAAAVLLEKLRKSGLVITPVSGENNWLSVNFVNVPEPPDSLMQELEKLAPQVAWLKLSGGKLSDTGWQSLGKCTKLTKLSLDHSNIADSSMSALKGLSELRYLNLSHTRAGTRDLSAFKQLKRLYLFNTKVNAEDLAQLRTHIPSLEIDTGGYLLPFLESDTARLKAPKAYQ